MVEGRQRLGISDTNILRPPNVFEEGMLGADAGIVQSSADAVGLGDLTVVVLQHIGAVAVQHARAAALQRGRVAARVDAFTGCLHTNQAGGLMGDVGMKYSHGIAAAAHAGQHGIGLRSAAALPGQHIGHLHQALLPNNTLKIAHHHGVGVRPGHRAYDVEGVVDIGDPIAHGLIERVFEGFAATLHRYHGGAQQFHAVDIGALALDVLAAHVDHAGQSVARADGGSSHPVLAGAGLGNHPWFAHSLGQHGLANGVVDLVGAGVVEVLAFEENLRATLLQAQALRMVNRRGAADKVGQLILEFGHEGRVMLVACIGCFELADGMREGF